ncbi:MAG: AraC family transcriptional regulator [Kiritimatiellaeota bacterium]|nr:AraC family transcriptional regulator [Kiritimatiellota bacterium]
MLHLAVGERFFAQHVFAGVQTLHGHLLVKVVRQDDQHCVDHVEGIAVAAAYGFHDESHFNRVFKQHFKTTPGKYRKRRDS